MRSASSQFRSQPSDRLSPATCERRAGLTIGFRWWRRPALCLPDCPIATSLALGDFSGDIGDNRWRVDVLPFPGRFCRSRAELRHGYRKPSSSGWNRRRGKILRLDTVRLRRNPGYRPMKPDGRLPRKRRLHAGRSLGRNFVDGIHLCSAGHCDRAVDAQLEPWLDGLQRDELTATGLDRLTDDLAEAEFVSAGPITNPPMFDGEELSVIFVRSKLAPNAGTGLEVVRIAEVGDDAGPTLVRSTAPLPTGTGQSPDIGNLEFANPVAVIRPPLSRVVRLCGPRSRLARHLAAARVSCPALSASKCGTMPHRTF